MLLKQYTLAEQGYIFIGHQKRPHTKPTCRETEKVTEDLELRTKSSHRDASTGVVIHTPFYFLARFLKKIDDKS